MLERHRIDKQHTIIKLEENTIHRGGSPTRLVNESTCMEDTTKITSFIIYAAHN